MSAMVIGNLALLTKSTPMVIDMITNGTVYEPLARSDGYLKKNGVTFFDCLEVLAFCLVMTH